MWASDLNLEFRYKYTHKHCVYFVYRSTRQPKIWAAFTFSQHSVKYVRTHTYISLESQPVVSRYKQKCLFELRWPRTPIIVTDENLIEIPHSMIQQFVIHQHYYYSMARLFQQCQCKYPLFIYSRIIVIVWSWNKCRPAQILCRNSSWYNLT